MAKDPVNNLNVLSQALLPTPQQVKDALPLTDKAQATVLQGRETVRRILDREDPRVYFEKPRTTTDASNPPTGASPPR